MSNKISIPQGGKEQLFRGIRELSGNGLLTLAISQDSVDALQVDTLHTDASATVIDGDTLQLSASPPGIVKVGDFIVLDELRQSDGFYKIATLSTTVFTDDTLTLDQTTRKVDSTVTSPIASAVLTDTGVNFNTLNVVAGDIVLALDGKDKGSEYLVLSVPTSTTLALDGQPQDGGFTTYIVFPPPTLVEFNPLIVGQVTTALIADGAGVPSRARTSGFGDAALSRVINRAVRGLSENVEFLKAVTENRIAVPTRIETPATHAGFLEIDITSAIGSGGVWTGFIDSGITPLSGAINQFLRVYDISGFDIEVGGVLVKVDDIQDGASATLLSQGFVKPADVSGGIIKVVFNLTIPTTQDFVVVFGDGLSLEDIVATRPDAFMRGEFVLTGVNDEVIPEISTARDSVRLGSHTTLDERLESMEANDQFWFWSEDDPKFTFTSGGTPINHGAIKILWENTEYSVIAGTIAISGTQGYIKASLQSGAITLSSIDSATFDPDTLLSGDGTAAPNEIIVASWSTNDNTIQVLQGGHSETVVARDSTRYGSQTTLLDRFQDVESRGQFWYWQGSPELRYVTNFASASGFSILHGGSNLDIIWNNQKFDVSPSILLDAIGNEGFIKASLLSGAATLTSISATTIDATTLASGDGTTGAAEIIVATWSKLPAPAKVTTLHTGQQTLVDAKLSELQGNRLFGGWFISAVSGATISIEASDAAINGRSAVNESDFELTAANFAGGQGAGWERIDIVIVDKLGTPSLIQGVATNSGPPAAPKTTSGRPVLAELFLRSQASLVPLDILDTNNGTDSFINQSFESQFAVNPEESVNNLHPSNLARNGAFLEGPDAPGSPLLGWSLQNVTSMTKESGVNNRIFGDFSAKIVNANSSSSQIFQNAGTVRPPPNAGANFLGDINAYLGRWLTFSAYLKLANKFTTDGFVSIVTDVGSLSSFVFLNDQRFTRTSVSFLVPENATTLEIRISGDSAAPSTTEWYVDGAMLSFGRHQTEFEHHPRMALDSDGQFRVNLVDIGQPTGGANLLVFF